MASKITTIRMSVPSDPELGRHLPFVHNRANNVAVTWKDLVIICGGTWDDSWPWSIQTDITPESEWDEDDEPWGTEFDSKAVYCHRDGKWFPKATYGEVPNMRHNAGAEVLDDTMYLMCGEYVGECYKQECVLKEKCVCGVERITNNIYSLDLNSWRWTKLNPKGTPPFKCSSLSTWIHNGKFYGFGGQITEDDIHFDSDAYPDYLQVTYDEQGSVIEGHTIYASSFTNQLFHYNVSDNCWEWPSVNGDIPSPRYDHTTIICGDSAILFGGMGIVDSHRGYMNDLYTLNLVEMMWTRAHRSMIARGIPKRRSHHSLTLVSSEAAVLFGGSKWCKKWTDDDYGYRDCWILNTKKLLRDGFNRYNPSCLWNRCWHQENRPSSLHATRISHRAVVEPVSKRLWILGGSSNWELTEPYPTEIISMSFNSAAPLRLLAMESALSHFDRSNPIWEANRIPEHLRTELEDRRSHMEEERRTGMVGQRYNKY